MTIHNYYGSRHGKGAADGESAVVKSKASRAVKSGTAVISTATEMFNFCQEVLVKITVEHECTYYRRSFYLLEEEVIHDRARCQINTIKGTRAIHSVMTLTANKDESWECSTNVYFGLSIELQRATLDMLTRINQSIQKVSMTPNQSAIDIFNQMITEQ